MKYAYIYCLNTKIRLTMLCLSGFEVYSRWMLLYLLRILTHLSRSVINLR